MKESSLRVLRQGVVAGLLGYAVVAVVFAIANVVGGRSPFQTAAVLGATLFYGATDPAAVTVSAPYVFAFNGLHLVTFLGFGIIGAALVSLANKGEQLWYLALFFWMFVAVHMIGAAQVFAIPLGQILSAAAVWAAGIGAAIVMGIYLVRANPSLRAAQSW
ncbi:MAG TPA: hypothetical protein PKC83_02415 [Gemmatimonadaceae bacterium]|nr:hypothetical protein [Gemmatimonadaceae bacterium]